MPIFWRAKIKQIWMSCLSLPILIVTSGFTQ